MRVEAVEPRDLVRIGVSLQESGRFEEAESYLRRAIELHAGSGEAYLALAEARMLPPDGSLISRALAALEDPQTGLRDRTEIHFALGLAFDADGRFAEAARHFDQANALARELHAGKPGFDPKLRETYPEKVAKIYAKETLREYRELGSGSEVPVFIVGMIRSGTTLLDRVLRAHAWISSAGELPFWQIAADRFNRRWYESGIEPHELSALQSRYLDVLTSESSGAPRVIDKQPLNFELLGMIHMAFPKAKFLHIKRNAADTCLSIYQHYFGPTATFAYEWDNIQAFYRSYMKFMQLWRNILPESTMLELNYEDLVRDEAGIARSICDFLDIEYRRLAESDMIDRIGSPSRWQARQPTHKESINKWGNYVALYPQLSALGSLHQTINP